MRVGKFSTLLILIVFVLTGCSTGEAKITNENNVSKIIEDQINNTSTSQIDTTNKSSGEKELISNTKYESVDYDLTKMGSDMIYATVYQMMVNPTEYIGKTFKIQGLYYASYYETTKQYYHYVIIQDATACCAQGIEFIWDDGSHIYPNDYPGEEASVVVTGVFGTYRESGDDSLYCRLSNAVLEFAK